MSGNDNTPDFEDVPAVDTTVSAPASDEPSELDLEVEDDENLDVDVPSEDDETEALPEGASPKAADGAKPEKAARVKAPEGYVKPVEFAKILSDHLNKVTPPQVVYSYLKNNTGPDAKNPFPVHAIDGYEWYIVPAEGLAWWDAKNSRVAAGKAARAEKAAKKAEKPTEAVVEAEGAEETAVTEAE
jgi:hypothetical protein